jgi:hypothetical protein
MARTIKATPIKTAVRPTTGSAVKPIASTVKPAVRPKVSAVKQPGYTNPGLNPVKRTAKKY